jgi:CDP-diacylglycerol--glycerol-3-phosphate 3-phosphatidyltransferase
VNLALAITLARIVFVPLIIYLIYLPEASLWAAFAFAVVSLTDWLDGYIARKYDQGTVLGVFLDPLADKLLVISVLIVFAVQLKVDVFSVILLVAREFAITGFRVIAASKGRNIAASYSAKFKTALQMTAIFFILAKWPYGLVLYYLSFFAALVSLVEYFWQNRGILKD